MRNSFAKVILLTLLGFVSACALRTEPEYPGSFTGSTGTPNYHDVVRSAGGLFVHNTYGNCVRTVWLNDRDLCAPQPVAAQPAPTPMPPPPPPMRTAEQLTREERTVYFAFDHADLTPAAKARLDTLADVLKASANVKEAQIVGYADRIGTVSYNLLLSKKRAMNVRDYLISRGYTKARVTETRWVGKSESMTPCPAGDTRAQMIACLWKDRRVEVELELVIEMQQPAAPPSAPGQSPLIIQ